MLPASPGRREVWRLPPGAWIGSVVAGLLISCAAPCPPEKGQTARRLDAARRGQAPAYAPRTFARAAELADRADAECRVQEARSILSRSFALAKQLHAEARAEAEKALREAAVNRGLARQEAFNSRYSAVQAVEEARASLLRARKARGEAGVLNLMDSLSRMQKALGDLQERIDRGDFLGARDMGMRLIREAIRLQAEANNRTLGRPRR